MNIGILKTSSNLHNSVIFCRSATMFTRACSGGKGALYSAIIVCVGAISGAPEQEYHILSNHRFPPASCLPLRLHSMVPIITWDRRPGDLLVLFVSLACHAIL